MVLNTIFLVREIRRNEQHDSFINAVTHELKTPVASIRLYLQTLQTRDLDEEKRREFYRIMLEDSDRLLHTIEQVLRAGSTGSRWRRIARTRVDLGEIVRECVELARTTVPPRPEALVYEQRASEDVPLVVGDPDELKAAVWNLIDNAVKYSGPATSRCASLLEEADGERLAVRVSDQGVGISPAELKRVFRRFYRIPGARRACARRAAASGCSSCAPSPRSTAARAFAESEGPGPRQHFHAAPAEGRRKP